MSKRSLILLLFLEANIANSIVSRVFAEPAQSRPGACSMAFSEDRAGSEVSNLCVAFVRGIMSETRRFDNSLLEFTPISLNI